MSTRILRIYIAGPMTGLPDCNYPAFHAEAARLRAADFVVKNPAENPRSPCGSWAGYMRMALRQISQCDAVSFLPGWNGSRGARLEHRIAIELGLCVIYHELPALATPT